MWQDLISRINRKNVVMLLILLAASAIAAVLIQMMCLAAIGPTSANTWYNKYWMVFFFISIFLIGLVCIFHRAFGSEPEYLYLLIVVLISVFFSWSLSTWQFSWDDGIHYRMILSAEDGGAERECSLSDTYVMTTIDPVSSGNANTVEDYSLEATYAREAILNAEAYEEGSVIAARSLGITDIAYVPCAAVLRICNLLGASFATSFFLIRLFCALFYSVITFLGMRKLVSGKALYAVVALIPTNIFLAANLSYAYWTYSLLLYGLASIVGMMQAEGQPTIRGVASMLGAFFLGCLPRIVYFPLILICLVLPKRKFDSPRNSRIYRACIIAGCLLTASVFFLPVSASGLGAGDSRGGADINPAGQVSFILHNPMEFLSILARFLLPPFSMEDGLPDIEGPYYVVSGFISPRSLRGWFTNYGYLPRPSIIFSVAVLFLLVFTALTDRDSDCKYGKLPAVVSWVVCIGASIMVITYMYLVFSNVGEGQIRGVQRRYMLPFVYPMLAFLGISKFSAVKARMTAGVYNVSMLAAMAGILLASWWQSYLMYVC